MKHSKLNTFKLTVKINKIQSEDGSHEPSFHFYKLLKMKKVSYRQRCFNAFIHHVTDFLSNFIYNTNLSTKKVSYKQRKINASTPSVTDTNAPISTQALKKSVTSNEVSTPTSFA